MQKRLGLDLEVSDEFGIGLAWYVTGEGCFLAVIYHDGKRGYKQLRLRFSISVRADDRPGLEYIHKMLGVGDIHDKKARGKSAPAVQYEVRRTSDLYHVIVPLFEKYPLPSQWRKAKDFEIWKQLVNIQYHEGGRQPLGFGPGRQSLGGAFLPQSFWDKVEPLVQQIKDLRKFR